MNTAQGQGGAPTGTIELLDGATSLGTQPLVAGVASISTAGLAAGTHTLSAKYSGDPTYAAGTGTASLTIDKAATTTTLVSSANPSNVGDDVTFSVTVASAATGFTGDVEIFDGTTSLGKATLTSGKASFSTKTLAQGDHTISATYIGYASFASSSSPSVKQSVHAATTSPSPDAGSPAPDVDASAAAPPADSGCSASPSGSTSTLPGAAMFALVGIGTMLTRRRPARATSASSRRSAR